MDLTEYERAKFELAAILRAAAIILREERPDVQGPFSDLFARLAEDRFNLVVVGRFSRGKTSLMNAMLDTERLPTGIVPLTSVITTVSYGSNERAFIEHEGWARALAREISLDELPDYVTQQRNPGNERHVALARVELPAELLRRGFYFVDTPGLGSSILENTRTTERFLPQADAFMLVTSYDSPLSEEELRVLQGVASSTSRIFLVVNKHDTVSVEDRDQVLSHVRDQARRVFGDPPPQIFSVSARDAIEARKLQDRERFADSGIAHLKEELTRFLLTEKQTEFLLRMCERIDDALRDVPNSSEEAERLRALHQEIAQHRPNAAPLMSMADLGATDGMPPFSSCWICARLDRGIYDFLCKYQYDVIASRDLQAKLAERGGLCAFHTWQYEAVASPRGTCIGFSALLEQLADRFRGIVATSPAGTYAAEIEKLRPTPENCDLCRARIDIERKAVADMARSLTAIEAQAKTRFSGLCLDHLRLVLEAIEPSEAAKKLLIGEAGVLNRVSEDMRRYALKHDGVRRFLASKEELSADKRALMLLAGHRNVNGLWKLL
jgi:small GTP-binding protein